jgi:hypothetical protein
MKSTANPNDEPVFGVTARDEATHPAEMEPAWNESWAFIWAQSAAWSMLRLAWRVNEGHVEATILQTADDGSILCGFFKPNCTDASVANESEQLSAAGLSFRIIEPLKRWQLGFKGQLRRFADPRVLANPREAFATAAFVDCEIDLLCEDETPAFGLDAEGNVAGMGKAHYEMFAHIAGTITVGGRRERIDAVGWRDHSWGKRNWGQIDYSRALICAGPGPRFSVLRQQNDGVVKQLGQVLRNGRSDKVLSVNFKSEYEGADGYYLLGTSFRIETPTDEISGRCTPYTMLPMRYRTRAGLTRNVQYPSLIEIDGRKSLGWIECVDVLVDGLPLGNSRAEDQFKTVK